MLNAKTARAKIYKKYLFFLEINRKDCFGQQINGNQDLPNMLICHQGESQVDEIAEIERISFNIR